MKVELVSEHPVNDEACKKSTGMTLMDWFARLDAEGLSDRRRDAISLIYDETKDPWWPTTIWVEFQRSKGVLLKDGRPDGYNICVSKTIAAPLSQVFAAFQGSSLVAWFGDEPAATPDGGFTDSNGNRASATRVRPDKDIRYNWNTAGSSDPTEVEVLFAEKGGKTGITLNHNRIQSREEADGLRKSWGAALTQLKELLEGAPR